MSDRIVILSDTHLGRPGGSAHSATALRPLWEGADHLIVNGDVAEVHHPQHNITAAREVLRLHDLCEDDNVRLTLLSGNHDPYITDLRHLTLADGVIFVTHGDVLHPAVAPWSPAAARMRETNEAAFATLEPEDRATLESHLWASQRASIAEWEEIEEECSRSTLRGVLTRPWALLQVLWYWHVIPGIAARFAREHAPRARFIVFGHTHRAGVWMRGDRIVINTGAYGFPGQPRAVVIEDGTLCVRRIAWDGAAYRLAAPPIATWSVPEATHGAMEARPLTS